MTKEDKITYIIIAIISSMMIIADVVIIGRAAFGMIDLRAIQICLCIFILLMIALNFSLVGLINHGIDELVRRRIKRNK